MKRLIVTVTLIFLMLFCAACGGSQDQDVSQAGAGDELEEVELVVSAAASLTDVTKELTEEYKQIAPNVTLTFTYGASGALQSQIEEGAPTDVFMSAAKKQMNALSEQGLIVEPSRDLLVNKIVLITPKDSQTGIESFEDCGTDKVGSVALGDPAAVPAGQYAQEVFTSLGVADEVNKKANLGSDVRQVLTWVEMGEVDCGVVFKTDALISDTVTIVAEAPEGSHTLAIYPVGIIEASANREEAEKFIEFLYSDEAKGVFEKYGFSSAE